MFDKAKSRSEAEHDFKIILIIFRFDPHDSYKKNVCNELLNSIYQIQYTKPNLLNQNLGTKPNLWGQVY